MERSGSMKLNDRWQLYKEDRCYSRVSRRGRGPQSSAPWSRVGQTVSKEHQAGVIGFRLDFPSRQNVWLCLAPLEELLHVHLSHWINLAGCDYINPMKVQVMHRVYLKTYGVVSSLRIAKQSNRFYKIRQSGAHAESWCNVNYVLWLLLQGLKQLSSVLIMLAWRSQITVIVQTLVRDF